MGNTGTQNKGDFVSILLLTWMEKCIQVYVSFFFFSSGLTCALIWLSCWMSSWIKACCCGMTSPCGISVLSASSLGKFSSTLCCVSVPCQETGVNAITYEMGLMWLLGPALGGAAMRIHVALISVCSQTQLSGEGEERSSVSIISAKWASQPEVFLIFIPWAAV